jgi:RNA polymerase sigma-70 factor (ECF subfamily)
MATATAVFPDFDAWLRSARPRLMRLAVSRLRDEGEAEDVVQDTVLAVWRRHQLGKVQDLDAYANRAVWQNSIRRKVRKREWAELDEANVPQVAPEGIGAEDWIDAEELEEAIDGLPATQQAVVRLRFYAGLSFKEIGDALSIGLNTAASRTRYALEALRKSLLPVPPAPERPSPPTPKQKEPNHGKSTRKRPRRRA